MRQKSPLIGVEHINDGEVLAVEISPEGVTSLCIVNQHLVNTHDRNGSTFHKEDFLLIRMSRKLDGLHSEPIESGSEVMKDNDE